MVLAAFGLAAVLRGFNPEVTDDIPYTKPAVLYIVNVLTEGLADFEGDGDGDGKDDRRDRSERIRHFLHVAEEDNTKAGYAAYLIGIALDDLKIQIKQEGSHYPVLHAEYSAQDNNYKLSLIISEKPSDFDQPVEIGCLMFSINPSGIVAVAKQIKDTPNKLMDEINQKNWFADSREKRMPINAELPPNYNGHNDGDIALATQKFRICIAKTLNKMINDIQFEEPYRGMQSTVNKTLRLSQ